VWWWPASRACSSPASGRGCWRWTSCQRPESCCSASTTTGSHLRLRRSGRRSQASGAGCATWRPCSRAGADGRSRGRAAELAPSPPLLRQLRRGRRADRHARVPRVRCAATRVPIGGSCSSPTGSRVAGPSGAVARGRYSARGLRQPGESLEEAVAREVREEAGVRVADAASFRSRGRSQLAHAGLRGAGAGEPAVHAASSRTWAGSRARRSWAAMCCYRRRCHRPAPHRRVVGDDEHRTRPAGSPSAGRVAAVGASLFAGASRRFGARRSRGRESSLSLGHHLAARRPYGRRTTTRARPSPAPSSVPSAARCGEGSGRYRRRPGAAWR
jgi:hypothetical protein